MLLCSNEHCEYKLFHLECLNLKKDQREENGIVLTTQHQRKRSKCRRNSIIEILLLVNLCKEIHIHFFKHFSPQLLLWLRMWHFHQHISNTVPM